MFSITITELLPIIAVICLTLIFVEGIKAYKQYKIKKMRGEDIKALDASIDKLNQKFQDNSRHKVPIGMFSFGMNESPFGDFKPFGSNVDEILKNINVDDILKRFKAEREKRKADEKSKEAPKEKVDSPAPETKPEENLKPAGEDTSKENTGGQSDANSEKA